MERRVRVRFAPSPTGALHIGGVRTALYNYLFARQHGGDMLLRIEDTDSTRFVPGAEEYILEALDWLGIGIDEGLRQKKGAKEIEAVGSHGPYRQSERRGIYHEYVKQLLDSGHAYIAFDREIVNEYLFNRPLYESKVKFFIKKYASPMSNYYRNLDTPLST